MSETWAQKIADEVEIVWTEGELTVMERYDYVRQTLVKTRNRRGAPRQDGWAVRIVGYANLREGAEPPPGLGSGRWERRVFYVKPNDRSEPGTAQEPVGYREATPTEAVDPRTVQPCVVGKLTDRARGRPAPGQGELRVEAGNAGSEANGMLF